MEAIGPPTVRDDCNALRREIKGIGEKVLGLKRTFVNGPWTEPEGVTPDVGEMIANVTLSYRHLEDSAMRLGKVIQAWDGGTSVYDK